LRITEPLELIRKKPLTERLKVSGWTLNRWIKTGNFPSPIWLSETVPAWRVSDVGGWLRARERENGMAGSNETA
jgi:predicted DNA-binding transcriptional regulator AlpA